MTTLSLDDTLHVVVQVTHEHGLPLDGATVHPGRVQVFTDSVDLRWWTRWLTDAAARSSRSVVWEQEQGACIAFHVSATREDIEWTVVERLPAPVASPVLTAHNLGVSAQHFPVPAATAIALADAMAAYNGANEEIAA